MGIVKLWASGNLNGVCAGRQGRGTSLALYLAQTSWAPAEALRTSSGEVGNAVMHGNFIFALVAIAYIMRIAQGWRVQVKEMGGDLSLSRVALGFSVA